MLGRKPYHAALGTPVLGEAHPCYLGNPHSLGGAQEPPKRGRSLPHPQCCRGSCGVWRVALPSPWGGGGRPAPLETLSLRAAAPGPLRLGGVPAPWRKPRHPEGVPTPSSGKRAPRNTPCTRRGLPALVQERAPPSRLPLPTSRSTWATPPSGEGLLLKTGKI